MREAQRPEFSGKPDQCRNELGEEFGRLPACSIDRLVIGDRLVDSRRVRKERLRQAVASVDPALLSAPSIAQFRRSRGELSAKNRQNRREEGKGGDAHADLRELRVARMIDMQPISDLLARQAGKQRVATEASNGERKPRTGPTAVSSPSTPRASFVPPPHNIPRQASSDLSMPASVRQPAVTFARSSCPFSG